MDAIKRCRAVLEAEIIDWDSFDFNGKSFNIKVSMILFAHINVFID